MPALPTLDRTEETAVSLAAASRAVRHILDGPPARATPLGTSTGVTWLEIDGYVLALSGPNPTRPPNGVAIAGPGSLPPTAAGCFVGNGRITTTDLAIEVSRWWDARPVLGTVSSRGLGDTTRLAMGLMGEDEEGLVATLAGEQDAALADAAYALLGKGLGLTPEGDDVAIGLLAGLRLLGESTRAPHTLELLDTLAPIVSAAPSRTTALSATLLRHAWQGEVSAPPGAFLHALTGGGDLEDAISMLGRLGATSGMAMGRGILIAACHVAEGGAS